MLDWESETNVVQRDMELMWNVLREDNRNIFHSNPSNIIQELQNCLKLAINCKSVLDQLERDFLLLYEENNKTLETNQAEIRKLELQKSYGSSHSGWPYVFGIPYFKGHDSFPAPLNQDAVEIQKKDYVTDLNLPPSYRWKEQDKKNLVRAVTREIETSKLLLKGQRKSIADSELPRFSNKLVNFSEDYLEDISKLDWMKISTIDLKERHNTNECIGMWLSYLHPSINKNKWNKKEEEKLAQIAEKHNYQDWERIAKELGTNRSAYQCIHHHQTRLNKNVAKKKWTEEENKKLEELVEHFRIGNFIPWNKIALCMEGRTKFQVYNHWAYTLHPSIKKGRFTKAEDAIILRGVKKYGADFGRISRYLPSRTSIQVRNRFNTFLQYQEPFKPWTAEEDEKLLDLVNQLGKGKWSQISKMFDNRNRTQIRHRYGAIQKWIKKNPGKRLNMTTRKVVANHCGPQKMLEVIENTKTTDLLSDDLYEVEVPKKLVKRRHVRRPFVKPNVPKGTKYNVKDVDNQLLSFFKSGIKQFNNHRQVRYNKDEIVHFSQQVKMQLTALCSNLTKKPTGFSKIDSRIIDLLRRENGSQLVQTQKTRKSKVTNHSYDTFLAQTTTNCSTSKETLFSIPPNYITLTAFKTFTSYCQNLDCNKWPAEDTDTAQELLNDKHSQTSKKGGQSNVHLKKLSPAGSENSSPDDDVRDFQSSISLWKQRLLSLFFWPKIMSEIIPPTLEQKATTKTTANTKCPTHSEPIKVLRPRRNKEKAFQETKDILTDLDKIIHTVEKEVKTRKISKTSGSSSKEVSAIEKETSNKNQKNPSRLARKRQKGMSEIIPPTLDNEATTKTAANTKCPGGNEPENVLRPTQKMEEIFQEIKDNLTNIDTIIHTVEKEVKLPSKKKKISKISDVSSKEVNGTEEETSDNSQKDTSVSAQKRQNGLHISEIIPPVLDPKATTKTTTNSKCPGHNEPEKALRPRQRKEKAFQKSKANLTNIDKVIPTAEKEVKLLSKKRKISKTSDSSNKKGSGHKRETSNNNQENPAESALKRLKDSCMAEIIPPTPDNKVTTEDTKCPSHTESEKVIRRRQKKEKAFQKTEDNLPNLDAVIHTVVKEVKLPSKKRKISKTSDSYCIEGSGTEKETSNNNPLESAPKRQRGSGMFEIIPPALDNKATTKITPNTECPGHNEPEKVQRPRHKKEKALQKTKDNLSYIDTVILTVEKEVKLRSKKRKISKTSDTSSKEVSGTEKETSNKIQKNLSVSAQRRQKGSCSKSTEKKCKVE